jgi:hypothetical protein
MLSIVTEKDTRLNFPMHLKNGAQTFLNIISFITVGLFAAILAKGYFSDGNLPAVSDVLVSMVVPILLFVFFSVTLLFGVKRAGMDISESGRITTAPLSLFGIRVMAPEDFRLSSGSLLIVKKVVMRGKNRTRTYYVVDIRPDADSGPDLRLAKSKDEVLAHRFAKEISVKLGIPIRDMELNPAERTGRDH